MRVCSPRRPGYSCRSFSEAAVSGCYTWGGGVRERPNGTASKAVRARKGSRAFKSHRLRSSLAGPVLLGWTRPALSARTIVGLTEACRSGRTGAPGERVGRVTGPEGSNPSASAGRSALGEVELPFLHHRDVHSLRGSQEP